MKRLEVDVPDGLAREVEGVVRSGWFGSEEEVLRAALQDFVRRQRLALLERQQLADIDWALQQKQRHPAA